MLLLNIAIVDDDKVMREYLEKYFIELCEEYSLNYKIDLYDSGFSLLKDNKKHDFVILDVEMENGNGIETKNVLMNRYHPNIIFLSNYKDKVLEAFGQNVIAYLDKGSGNVEIELKNIFTSYFNKKYISIGDNIISLENIYYFEANSSYTNIYTRDKEYVIRKTLKDIENDILDYCFFRIHRSYIINFKYLKNIDHLEVVLSNDEKLKISRGKIKSIKEAYILYVRGGKR